MLYAKNNKTKDKRKGKTIMKKLAAAFVTVLIVAGMAASASADPGWSHGPRHNDRGRFERPQHQYYQPQHQQRDYRNHWNYQQPVVVHRAPIVPPRPVVHAYEPQAASFSMFLPGFSIQVR